MKMFWTAIIKRCCPGHGEEYYYEDDGTWTSLCLALPPPQPSVRLLKTHFVLPLFRADPTFNIQGEIAAVFEGWSPCTTTCHSVKNKRYLNLKLFQQ